jgi:Ca-activated chloride channel homolog
MSALLKVILLSTACLFLITETSDRRVSSQSPSPTPPTQDQDDDVIRVNTDLVVLNVTVVDANGKFVSGLRRADFSVIEDGAEQKTSAFSAEQTPFAAAILLDTSGSMENRMRMARSAAIRFLDGLREEDVAAVYSFNTKVEQWSDYSPGRDLPARVFGLQTRTYTALNDAIYRAADDLAKREEKRRAIVVLSDGGENFSTTSADKALDRAALAGATIYGVNMSAQGPGRDLAGAAILRRLADKSGGRYVDQPGGQDLRDALGTIVEELGHQYTITYRPTNRAKDGKWRAIDVKLAKPNVTVRTRKGYRAPKG